MTDRLRGSELWINMGCGDRPAPPPWVNADSWAPLEPDVVMDATRKWPWPSSSAARVFMGQLLEHLPYPWGVRYALREAHRVLGEGGILLVICPDFLAMKEKKAPADAWRETATGMRRWPGDAHLWMPNRNIVRKEVERRFGNVELLNHLNLDESWPRGGREPWDCTARAEKIRFPLLAS
jgi:predicted SAM-dependent methyltransferase